VAFATIIVSSANVERARTAAATFEGGEGMFIVPCYAGTVKTHYISAGKVSGDIIGALTDIASISTADPLVALERMGLTLNEVA